MKLFVFISVLLLIVPHMALMQSIDFDKDGISDRDEVSIYYTDPHNPDTDGDGYEDGVEIYNHFSPHEVGKSLSQTDLDQDGVSDWLEWQFGTDWNNSDTDGDGYPDQAEIAHSYDPLNPEPVKLKQKIVINTETQEVTAYLADIPLNTYVASTGAFGYETPPGIYQVENKHPRAWSRSYGLWMPYWMGFIGTTYGIHALPEWPGGYKEGVDHLGTPVSHGCVRLGDIDAEWLYYWADVGTEVEVL